MIFKGFMATKNIGIKEETSILLNKARATLQKENPQKRYYDDDVVFYTLTEFLTRRINNAETKKPKRTTSRK